MQEACACAIRMLLENEIEKFPIDLKNIKQYQGNRIIYFAYEQARNIISTNDLEALTETNDALTIYEDNIYCVIYNDKVDYTLEQKNIAHELGHIACRHKIKDNIVGKNSNTGLQEAEADLCSYELLAPTIVLQQMGILTTDKIQATTGVSRESAEKILANVMQRDSLKCPFLSDEEKQLWENFKKNTYSNTKRPRITFKNIFMAMMSVITICVILLVILDSKNNFILKGNYVEPQYEENTPLTPDDYYPTNNDKDNFFEPKATKNNATPTKNNYEDNYTVYITEHGEKYHKTSCRYLSDSKIAIDIHDAIAEGYEPCSVCKP